MNPTAQRAGAQIAHRTYGSMAARETTSENEEDDYEEEKEESRTEGSIRIPAQLAELLHRRRRAQE